MKRLISILLALFLLAALSVPALAAPIQSKVGPRGVFSLAGIISSIDSTAGTVTIDVLRGNFLVKPYFGQQITVTTTSATRYLYKASPTAISVLIKFADLKVGDPISVNGLLANNVWKAVRVTVGANLACLP